MDSRYLIYALSDITAVIYVVTIGKPSIATLRPSYSPFLDTFRSVPVVVILFVALVLPTPLFIDFLKDAFSLFIKVIDQTAFGCPFAILGYASHSCHNMSVRISVPFIVQTPIHTHTLCIKTFYKITNSLYLFFSAQFLR